MSDTEETKRRMSEDSSSSEEDSSLHAGKAGQALDNSGFRVDGEPVNKPRKDSESSSDSSSEEADNDVEDSTATSKSESVSDKHNKDHAVSQSSSSESAKVADAADRKADEDDESSSETEDDVSKDISETHDDEDEPVVKQQPPVPMARKMSEELTKEEQEMSKRETMEIKHAVVEEASDSSEDEGQKEEPKQKVEQPHVEVKVEEAESSEDEEVEEAVAAAPPPVVAAEPEPVEDEVKPRVNGGGAEIKRPQFRHSSASSLSDEEIIPDQQTSHKAAAAPAAATVVSPVPSPAAAPAAAAASPSPNSVAIDERKKELFAATTRSESPIAPSSPVPTRANAQNLTKIYTEAVENNNNVNGTNDKAGRSKPSKDITQIYTAGIVKTTNTPPASPKPVPSRSKDITQLYTGGFNNKNATPSPTASPCIAADKLNPKKHNMSTAMDKDAIRQAYDDVRSDNSNTEWAVFKFDGNQLKAAGTGNDFKDFKASFANDDRGFGYIRITTGDELSKRAKFVFVTWVGPSVSVMKKAKMSTDKALMKDIIQNMSVELQFENHAEFSHDHFKSQVDKAAGARYGTGERAL